MWIRSQNKKSLINANEIWIPQYKTGNGIPVYGNHATHEDSCTVLGTYPTEAEAMKVLDMIQNHVHLLAYPYPDSEPSVVFQMPEAGFSEEVSHG